LKLPQVNCLLVIVFREYMRSISSQLLPLPLPTSSIKNNNHYKYKQQDQERILRQLILLLPKLVFQYHQMLLLIQAMKRIILSEHYQFPPTITVSCSSSTRLTDIDNKLHDASILAKQSPTVGVWFLNANLVIAKALTFSLPFLPTKVRPVQ